VSSPVELIVGPARSGKAGRVLAAYLDALARAEPGRCLMLVPTALRRRATETRLLAAQPSGVLAWPQVLTIHELADRLLSAAGRPVRRIGELARRSCLRQCLARLSEKQAAVLGPVLSTPGLVEALDELFRELKAARVEPDDFGRAMAGPMRTPRNRLLAILYDAYQKALQDREVYDDAGQFWHAAALVAESRFGPFENLEILAVDGFQDFAPAQLDMLQALASRAKRTLITLTWQPGRPSLFAVTARTRERLRERFAGRLTETVADEPSGLAPDLERVRTHLFGDPDGPPPPAAGSIAVIRAAGRTREVEEVARRIADLLRRGADRAAGIAVIARRLEAYADLVRDVFPRYGIPFRIESHRVLEDCPIVRAAMAPVRLQVENYSFRALARLLKSNYFNPSAFGADAETARQAVRLAREANICEGRENYFRGLDALRSTALREADVADDAGEPALPEARRQERIEAIARAGALLTRLFADLELPARGPRRTLAERLRSCLRAAGFWQAARASPTVEGCAADIKALAALEEVLEEVALLQEADADEVTLESFLAEVAQGLRLASVPAEEPAGAPVVVLDVHRSRALSFDHVFLLGLAEKEFPQRGRRHPFFSDAEREDLRRRGVDLADTSHQAQQEMLLFYLAATRARETLTLAYPSLDAQGRPALASHYVEELAGLFAARGRDGPLPATEISTRDLDLESETPAASRSERELLAATMYDLWGPGPADRPDEDLAILDAMLARGPAAETALAGLAVEWEREHGETFGPFDGRLAAPEIVEELCRRFPGQAAMSARRLETFGACPFAFFAGDLLGLAPLEEPSADLAPLEVGLIYHGLLERFFSALAASPALGGRLTEESLATAQALLAPTAETYFAALEKYGRVGSPALWKIQKRHILRDVGKVIQWHAGRLAEWRAAYTEVPFGALPGTKVRPPGRREPIAIESPHGPIRLRGRIDRVDLAADGPGWQVVDYKSGSPPGPKDMKEGTSLQLPIYLWAARELLGPEEARGTARAMFLPVRRPRAACLLASATAKGEPSEAFGRALARAAVYVRRYVDAMRRGLYPVYPRQECSGRCDFQEICRFAEWRIRRKRRLHPIEALEPIPDEASDGEEADA